MTTSSQRHPMRLGGWSLLTDVNHSYDLPRSNMAQQHPGAGGYKVEPGVPPNAGDHEPVSWHISIYLVLRYHSHRVAAKCCRMLYGLYSVGLGAAGTSIASRTVSATFDLGCVL